MGDVTSGSDAMLPVVEVGVVWGSVVTCIG